ncbi:DsbA family protein [Halomonas aquamarina]|uniref:DsbA family protein n=1 Tax=Vreelandella aquamarina TaxID=77097 RepID=A0ACC5VWH7_9GAMM|nr:DsbA family protein [Halomonas aquamarina]MBZ5488512.1 DsbA family protein [Halomonas aquamarina]
MTRLVYLFDPLCGWCYGAAPALAAAAASNAITLEPMPTGLFAGSGGRAMDEAFAAYAWENDQRIAALTGQPFTEAYRRGVLESREQRFDSAPATRALTAVHLTAAEREFAALEAFQRARYAEGRDVTDRATLVELLDALALFEAASLLKADDETLRSACERRVVQAQTLMQRFSLRGVPSLLVEKAGALQPLKADALYSSPAGFVESLSRV